MKSSKPRKTLIDLLGASDAAQPSAVGKQWYLAELFALDVPLSHFERDMAADVHAYAEVLGWCLKVLAQSPCAKAMLREAVDKNWVLALEDLNGGDYCLDVEQRLLILDNNALVPSALGRSVYFRHVTLMTLLKALRDIWQEKRHGGFDEHYKPDSVILMERVRAADCDVVAVFCAWELRAGGAYPDLWKHVLGSEFGDMGMVLAGALERDVRGAVMVHGLRAAFQQWFRSEARVNSCDHDTLEGMDEVMAMAETHNPFGKKKPTKMAVEVLSCLPDKTAYLQGFGAEVLSDPLYCGMIDGINQTHLFHILYDLEAVMVENVPFRDAGLAARIFPPKGSTRERVR